MKIALHDLFHTPKDFAEIEAWIAKHPQDVRVHLYTVAFMTWNLLAAQVNTSLWGTPDKDQS